MMNFLVAKTRAVWDNQDIKSGQIYCSYLFHIRSLNLLILLCVLTFAVDMVYVTWSVTYKLRSFCVNISFYFEGDGYFLPMLFY